MLFFGIGIGSFNPTDAVIAWIVPMIVGVVLLGIDIYDGRRT